MLSLIEMSAAGGMLITVIILLRALMINRMPKHAFLVLWAVALGRLMLPFRLPSPVSIFGAAQEHILKNVPAPAGAGWGARPLLITGGEAPAEAGALSLLPAVWLAGMILLALAFLITHLRSRRDYLSSLPVDNGFVRDWMDFHRLRRPVQVRYSDRIGAPLTYGILWPVILLPKSMDWADEETLGYILAHELSHIRRFDALTKWLSAAVLCIHWFNPLVWAMYVLANRDLELSCDEAVLRQYGLTSRSAYALALVGMEERRTCPAPLVSGFSRQALKERLMAIMKSRPLTVGSIAAACVLVAAIAVLFATTAPSADQTGLQIQQDAMAGSMQPLQETGQVGGSGQGSQGSGQVGGSGQGPQDSVQTGGSGQEPEDSGMVDSLGQQPQPNGNAPYSDPESGTYDMKKKDEEDETGYTKEQYEQLIGALSFPGYKDMSIAEFNRSVNAVFFDENHSEKELFEVFHEILYSISEEDPNAAYLINTVQTSLMEYEIRMAEVYSGERKDFEHYGETQLVQSGDVFGDAVSMRQGEAEYGFTYRILDQDGLTVGERDLFLQQIAASAQAAFEENGKADMTENEYKKAIEKAGREASTEEIEFTGCEIGYFEIY